MFKIVVRALANTVVMAGVFLLVRVLYGAVTGSLVPQVVSQSAGSWIGTAFALGLTLPIPFHVISIGLFLQRSWLPVRLAKAARLAIVISGCWLGVALCAKLLIL